MARMDLTWPHSLALALRGRGKHILGRRAHLQPVSKHGKILTEGISSLVVDELCDRAADQKIAVACFYCDFQNQKMQSPENVLGALVKQIVRRLGGIPDEIDEAFRKAKGEIGGRGLRVPEVLSLLKVALAPLDRAFICIDALDELLVRHLPTLLRSLHDISQSCPGVRFLFTGRPHIGIEIEKYFPGAARFLQMKGTTHDIMRYVEMMLDDDPNPEAMNDGLRAEIMNRVSETISDVYAAAVLCSRLRVSLIVPSRFLLVSLKIAAILDGTTIYHRREQLERMTNGQGLNDVYGVTLGRITGQTVGKSTLGMAALLWISQSERPMSVDELCHALGVQIGSTDYNPDSIPSMQTVLASCLGLITVDKEGSKVRLVHFTLHEYFDSGSEILQNPYVVMAEVCLTYLNFDCIRRLQPTPATEAQKYPFLRYASYYWGRYAGHGTTEGVKLLALRLLDGFDNHISSRFLYSPHVDVLPGDRDFPKGFTGLHCVAFLGIDEISEALLDSGDWDVERADSWGRTPLILASLNGHEGIIRLLLEKRGANINTKERSGQTPLSCAAGSGREEIVKLLLACKEVNPELRDNFGHTPLSYAAMRAKEGVVELLLQHEGVNPEPRDNSGRTPLAMAATAIDGEGAVKLLLEREEVNPESQDNFGPTPLSHAAESGREGVVKLLLEREEVNPESQDNSGRTPLSHAAESGREGVVKLLLEREEVNPESQDNSGRTPLAMAATAIDGEGAVKLLLEREEVNPESQDNFGRTPLSHAAESGREGVVKLLLEREEVNPESQDNSGRMPLSHATESGREGVVKLHLKRKEVNPESRDNDGRTPLSHAAESGEEETAKLLLGCEGVNPESRDNYGRTPLSHGAGAYEGERAVKLLLERQDVNPELQDNNGRTPLSHAAGNYWGEGAVKLLLQREDVNTELQDNSGRTPLSHAAAVDTPIIGANEGEGAVKLLLERQDINPESRDNSGRTPLSYAAGAREGERAVRLLLELKQVNPDSIDNSGRTPLSHASSAYLGQEAVRLLLERKEVNPESRDNSGRTPLSHAARCESERAVKLLLEREEVNPESRDNSGRTPRSYARGKALIFLSKHCQS